MIIDPYLEASEQLDRFFPTSLHKIKFHMFQNISEFSKNYSLIPFKYIITLELCDDIIDKLKRNINYE